MIIEMTHFFLYYPNIFLKGANKSMFNFNSIKIILFIFSEYIILKIADMIELFFK